MLSINKKKKKALPETIMNIFLKHNTEKNRHKETYCMITFM